MVNGTGKCTRGSSPPPGPAPSQTYLLLLALQVQYTTLYQPCGIGGQRALDCVLCVPPPERPTGFWPVVWSRLVSSCLFPRAPFFPSVPHPAASDYNMVSQARAAPTITDRPATLDVRNAV